MSSFNIDRAAIEDECAALRPVDGIAIGRLRNESGRVVVKNAVADVENVIGIGGIESHHRAVVFTRFRPNDVFVRLVDKVGTFIVRCASKSRTVDAGESGNHGKANHFLRIHFVSPLQTECLPYSKLSLIEAHPVNLHQNGTTEQQVSQSVFDSNVTIRGKNININAVGNQTSAGVFANANSLVAIGDADQSTINISSTNSVTTGKEGALRQSCG